MITLLLRKIFTVLELKLQYSCISNCVGVALSGEIVFMLVISDKRKVVDVHVVKLR